MILVSIDKIDCYNSPVTVVIYYNITNSIPVLLENIIAQMFECVNNLNVNKLLRIERMFDGRNLQFLIGFKGVGFGSFKWGNMMVDLIIRG